MRRFCLLVAAVAWSAPVTAATIAFRGGTVVLGDGGEPIVGGTVVVRDGKVVAAGRSVAIPPGAELVDASGQWVTPGIVAGMARIGLVDVDLGVDGADDAEAAKSPFGAAIDASRAVNPVMMTVAVSRAAGVTRAIIAPGAGASIFDGQGAVIDLAADPDPITRRRAFQWVELGEEGADKAGGSRASADAVFRNALAEARELARGATAGGRAKRRDDVLLTRLDAAALVPVVEGRQLLVVHVERAADILNVLGLRHDYPRLKLAIVGAGEGWTVARQLAESGVWVIANPVEDLPASFETLAATQSNVGRMRAAGVKVAVGLVGDSRNARTLRQYAGNLVALGKVPGATGVSWGEAFALISSRPAEAIGLGGSIGRLSPGAHGDVVLWSGDPLENASSATAVWIDGVRQPIDNHQTDLRDRYRTIERQDLPPAYRR